MTLPDALRESLLRRIYDINEKDFEGVAIDLFQYQYEENPLYREYCRLVDRTADMVFFLTDIPFLPITFFRDQIVRTGTWQETVVFGSSGTTGRLQSRHFIRDKAHYHRMATQCFSRFFGAPSSYTWLGLLPSYLDRPDSSLVDMIQAFMDAGRQVGDHFYPVGNERLLEDMQRLKKSSVPTVLTGVSFALLDFFSTYDVPVWDGLIVMETGGMKGRGKELTRDELYATLRHRHPDLQIFSEYGMTELLSQAYRVNDHFMPGPSMRVLIRDISDPFEILGCHRRGGINVIDLGNVDTCAFIATDDAGILYPDGGFDVLGRLDATDLRGCNLMYTSS